ncbi:hypothetical protein MPLDJ20_190099 [Mesorhizobium plurifarium]|uniref:Uncharacterized protein n=1 Tax=Mesorhizobium plurifarium TaxID=69974 RepID=A0A090ETB8_MESPL|nr:hypothetical protein MPLDJ20_190099 [Mesorhizobium plurifarium]
MYRPGEGYGAPRKDWLGDCCGLRSWLVALPSQTCDKAAVLIRLGTFIYSGDEFGFNPAVEYVHRLQVAGHQSSNGQVALYNHEGSRSRGT